MNTPRILECTLRDGSYAIDFQFTEEDTRLISSALESVGFELIEVGHGVGLGASRAGKGVAAETDETYMRAAAESLTSAEWGMFCIPGIATLDDLELAGSYGMNFVRIGTNVEDFRESKPFITKARNLGMFVCSNFMKSYASSTEEFAEVALAAEEWGSELVYVVDSAGGMLPRQVRDYIQAVRNRSKTLKIGFHGHNNLGLAVANSLSAVEAGAVVVDSSLQGFGRSAGNAPTEQLLCALVRSGYVLGLDPIKILDVGEKLIAPMILSRGLVSVDIVAGLAQFHSSYMNIIRSKAIEYRVDPRRLIMAVCEKEKVHAPIELVEREAKALAARDGGGRWKPRYLHYYGTEQI